MSCSVVKNQIFHIFCWIFICGGPPTPESPGQAGQPTWLPTLGNWADFVKGCFSKIFPKIKIIKLKKCVVLTLQPVIHGIREKKGKKNKKKQKFCGKNTLPARFRVLNYTFNFCKFAVSLNLNKCWRCPLFSLFWRSPAVTKATLITYTSSQLSLPWAPSAGAPTICRWILPSHLHSAGSKGSAVSLDDQTLERTHVQTFDVWENFFCSHTTDSDKARCVSPRQFCQTFVAPFFLARRGILLWGVSPLILCKLPLWSYPSSRRVARFCPSRLWEILLCPPVHWLSSAHVSSGCLWDLVGRGPSFWCNAAWKRRSCLDLHLVWSSKCHPRQFSWKKTERTKCRIEPVKWVENVATQECHDRPPGVVSSWVLLHPDLICLKHTQTDAHISFGRRAKTDDFCNTW